MLIARSQLAHSSRQCDPRCMFVGITQCDSEVMGLNLDVMPVVCICCEFLLRGCLHVSDLGMMKCYNFLCQCQRVVHGSLDIGHSDNQIGRSIRTSDLEVAIQKKID